MRRLALVLVLSTACASESGPLPPKAPPPPPKTAVAAAAPADKPPTVEEAVAWLRKTDGELKKLFIEQQQVSWVNETFITHDTNELAALADQKVMGAMSRALKEARRFAGVTLPPEETRMLQMLRISAVLIAQDRPELREELAKLSTELKTLYSTGKVCSPRFGKAEKDAGKKAKKARKGHEPAEAKQSETCLDLTELGDRMRTERDYDVLLELWRGWHDLARPMRPLYARQSALANAGARELGFADTGDLWRARYDMPSDAFAAESDRLWGQVKPLYDQLHCYVRRKLHEKYGAKVPDSGPIPAHLLGNMWAQEWGNIYPLVEPYPGQSSLDVTTAIGKAKWDAVKMVKVAEGFYTSLGLKPLPRTFWERSMLTQPRDREVVCHASAWDLDYDQDVRVKMCIRPTQEELVTIHHELGHNYYQFYYPRWPVLLQDGANDGFHEAIGDAVALSVTPAYLKQIGLFDRVPEQSDKAHINQQMRDALDKIAFLPFGLLIDRWRWDVYGGKVPEDQWNAHWWALRKKYQGVAAPVARTEADFDPGAKYHVASGVPYMRYFLARLLQFQFHRAMCRAAGHAGALDACSVYGSKAAGDKLRGMLEMGASRPWPEALAAISDERQMDANALMEYFQPLSKWLEEQNRGQRCGW